MFFGTGLNPWNKLCAKLFIIYWRSKQCCPFSCYCLLFYWFLSPSSLINDHIHYLVHLSIYCNHHLKDKCQNCCLNFKELNTSIISACQTNKQVQTMELLHCWLRARRALSLFNDAPLRTRRALLPQTLYSNSACLVLNGTCLNSINAHLALNWWYGLYQSVACSETYQLFCEASRWLVLKGLLWILLHLKKIAIIIWKAFRV